MSLIKVVSTEDTSTTAAGTTTTISLSQDVPAGSSVIVLFSQDANRTTVTPAQIGVCTDSLGNTYAQDYPSNTITGSFIQAVYSRHGVAAMPAGTTLSVSSFGSATANSGRTLHVLVVEGIGDVVPADIQETSPTPLPKMPFSVTNPGGASTISSDEFSLGTVNSTRGPGLMVILFSFTGGTPDTVVDYGDPPSDLEFTLIPSQAAGRGTHSGYVSFYHYYGGVSSWPFYRITQAGTELAVGLGVRGTVETDQPIGDTIDSVLHQINYRAIGLHYVQNVGGGASIDRGPDTRLVTAVSVGSTLRLEAQRWNDSQPEAVTQRTSPTGTITGVDSVSLRYRKSSVLDLFYAEFGTVKHTISRDQGRTWSVATTVAADYDGVSHVLANEMMVTALYKASESKYYVSVGTLDEPGETWTFSTPATLVTNAKPGGQLYARKDGTLEFAYVNSAGSQDIRVVRCRSIDSTGAGTWS